MRCPYCHSTNNKVLDSRNIEEENTIKRRRECNFCQKRFTTFEMIEKTPLMVIKNDGKRVVFEKDKIFNGILQSCHKREIPIDDIISLTDDIEKLIINKNIHEIPSKEIGEIVMESLKNFDKVAYIRFASVYRKFSDVGSIKNELDKLDK